MFTEDEMPRKYELKRRAERQAETRRRIVEATVALHEELGPARTTIRAIAERAGVERLTVYRHFPDDLALFRACSAHYDMLHPAPDPTPWAMVADPVARLRQALTELYAYYRETEQMQAHLVRDAPHLPALEILDAVATYWEQVRHILLDGWDLNEQDRPALVAALTLALDFGTWQVLIHRSGLDDEQAVELLVDLVACAAAKRVL